MSDTSFSTERMQLAIYLHASGKLQFLRCVLAGNGKVGFLFADPNQQGPELEMEFDGGALISATLLFGSQKYMRHKMSMCQGTKWERRPAVPATDQHEEAHDKDARYNR